MPIILIIKAIIIVGNVVSANRNNSNFLKLSSSSKKGVPDQKESKFIDRGELIIANKGPSSNCDSKKRLISKFTDKTHFFENIFSIWRFLELNLAPDFDGFYTILLFYRNL